MGFPRQEYWSGLPYPSPGDIPDPGIEPTSPALAGGFFTTEPPGKPSRFEKLQIKRKLNLLTNQNAQLPSATRFKLLKTLNCQDLQNRPLITFSETIGILNT